MDTFLHSELYRDLIAALEADWLWHFSRYLGPNAPTAYNERYAKGGYPAPRRDPNCWCPSKRAHRCPTQQGRVGIEQCKNLPRLLVGEGFYIVKCGEYHGPLGDDNCRNGNCFQWIHVIVCWARLVCRAQEEQDCSTKVSDELQERVANFVAGYGYTGRTIWKFVKIICIVIENYHEPSSRLGTIWRPEVHGVTWLQGVSRSEVVRAILVRMRNAKADREDAAYAATYSAMYG